MFSLMRRIALLVLVVVVAALVAGDLAAKHFAEQRIADAIHEQTHGVAEVDASIHSFPFVGRLLVQGAVSSIHIHLRDVAGHGIGVADLEAATDDLRLDRQVLISKQHVRITGVDTVTVIATITEQAIRDLLHVDVPLPDGVTATVSGGRLHLPGGVSVPVPDAQLLPCAATATVEHQTVRLTCVAHQLPQIVVDAIGSASLRH